MARPRSAETQARIAMRAKLRGKFFDKARVRRALERANYEALRKIGHDVKEAAKRGIGQRPPAKTKAGAKAVNAGAVIELAGGLYRDLTMLGRGKARPAGKPIKSWTPKRFAYYDIVDFFDSSRKSAVIGAYKADWLGRLHEFGGSLKLTAYRIGVGAARAAWIDKKNRGRNGGRDSKGRFLARKNASGRKYEYGAILWATGGMRSRAWDRTTITKTARYPARPYMQGAAGVQKVVARARERFRDTLRAA